MPEYKNRFNHRTRSSYDELFLFPLIYTWKRGLLQLSTPLSHELGEYDNRRIMSIIRTGCASSNMQTGSYAILLSTYYLCRFRWRPPRICPNCRIPANDDISTFTLP